MDIIPKTVQRKTFTTLANETKNLITAAQNGDKQALEQLCLAFEPLFRSEMRRDMFYNALGFEEGLSLARLSLLSLYLHTTELIINILQVRKVPYSLCPLR